MSGLLRFIYQYRTFFVFLLLEIVSGWLVVQNNYYQTAAFFHTSNHYAGRMLAFSNNIASYLNLRNENQRLALENAQLRSEMRLSRGQAPAAYQLDSALAKKYKFIVAKVIQNSVRNVKNYITLDKGTADGVRPGMGVITANGVIGKVRTCSEHFSTLISVLHVDMLVSAVLKNSGTVGSVRWDGNNPREVRLREIPRDVQVKTGDTVLTSQYNSVFPEGVLIGRVKTVSMNPDETFHNISVSLASDFQSVGYVYVIDNQLKTEQEALEKQNK